jgi:hypothetical protein
MRRLPRGKRGLVRDASVGDQVARHSTAQSAQDPLSPLLLPEAAFAPAPAVNILISALYVTFRTHDMAAERCGTAALDRRHHLQSLATLY